MKAPEYYKKDAQRYHQRFVILLNSGLLQRHITHRQFDFQVERESAGVLQEGRGAVPPPHEVARDHVR